MRQYFKCDGMMFLSVCPGSKVLPAKLIITSLLFKELLDFMKP
jgi:hypothetical protein